jgi:hypothetical protein
MRRDSVSYLVGLAIHRIAVIRSSVPRRRRPAAGVPWMTARRRALDPAAHAPATDKK